MKRLSKVVRENIVLVSMIMVMILIVLGATFTVLNKKKIQCACLGTVFNLPMSTVTILEDGLMILMSGIMLLIQIRF